MTIKYSRFLNNESTGSNSGGAIQTFGTLNVENSFFQGNDTKTGSGGAIYLSNATGTIRNSTFTGNISQTEGMAIYAWNGTLTLENVTIVGNQNDTYTDTSSAGLDVGGSINMTMRNSLLSGNVMSDGTSFRDCLGTIDTYSGNLINDAGSDCSDAAAETDDPDLGSLSNGVFPLSATSKAGMPPAACPA